MSAQPTNPLFRSFKTNPQLEREGVWIDYGPNSKGKDMRVLLARAGGANEDYNKALEAATRPYRRAISAGTLDKATIDRLYLGVFAKTVVRGWENMEDEQCEPLPFSEENVVKLAGLLPELYADWQEQANRLAIYREQLLESDVGNFGKS